MEKRLILASQSPRRKELLEIAGFEFEIMVSDAEEIKGGLPAKKLAMQNAFAKTVDIYEKTGCKNVVIGADTVVCLGDEILGKPCDEEDAFRMLKALSGSNHSVITGYAAISEKGTQRGYCETKVKFHTLTDEEIRAYIATGEPMDKAGAYGIQEKGSVFVAGIEGDYFNVMGLPVATIAFLLKYHGILPAWQNVLS